MARSRKRDKGRCESGRFIRIPVSVMDSPDFKKLSGAALKLLLALCYQYKGNNNGDLTTAFTVMRAYGFTSKGTLDRAKKQLLEAGLIVMSRQGRFMNPGGICDLYAITWLAVDECGGKLEIPATNTPIRNFSLDNQKRKRQG